MTYEGPLVWTLVMLLMFCVTIIALLLDRPPNPPVEDDTLIEYERRLP